MTANKSRGFTLVELSLVMAFISLLLLAILFTTIHIGKIYAKGVTNRQLNQVGRELVDTVRRDFLVADAAHIVWYPSPMAGGDGSGRICLGKVSYVWNTAQLLQQSSATKIMSKDGSTPVVFERVEDPQALLCTPDISGAYPTNLAGLAVGNETYLLDSEGRSLAVYTLSIAPVMVDGSDGLYKLNMAIGTNDPGIVDTSAVQCKPPSDNSSNFEYCAIADFDITVRAGGDST